MSDLGISHVTRVGTACYIRLYLRVTHAFNSGHGLTTLPEEFRPTKPVFVVAEVTNDGNTSVVHGDVSAEGKVSVTKNMEVGGGILLWGAWAVEV